MTSGLDYDRVEAFFDAMEVLGLTRSTVCSMPAPENPSGGCLRSPQHLGECSDGNELERRDLARWLELEPGDRF